MIPPRLDRGKNKNAAATGQAQKTQTGILPILQPHQVTPPVPTAKSLVSTAGAPTANLAAASAEIVRVAEPGGGHNVHFPAGLLTMPAEGTSGAIRSLEKRSGRRPIKTPSVVDSSNDEEDGDEYRPTPPAMDGLQSVEEKPLEIAQRCHDEQTKELTANGYHLSDQPCQQCIRTGVECWRPNRGTKKARSKNACLTCANIKKSCRLPNEPEAGGGMTLATELGELTKYFRPGSEGQFSAPGALSEHDLIPENVGQLFAATLVGIRSLQEGQHAIRSDIAELRLILDAQSQQWKRDMRLTRECFNELPSMRMMEPMFRYIGALVLDTTHEVQDARESIQQLIAQGAETLDRVSITVPS